jgi:hypothetical protein
MAINPIPYVTILFQGWKTEGLSHCVLSEELFCFACKVISKSQYLMMSSLLYKLEGLAILALHYRMATIS